MVDQCCTMLCTNCSRHGSRKRDKAIIVEHCRRRQPQKAEGATYIVYTSPKITPKTMLISPTAGTANPEPADTAADELLEADDPVVLAL